MIYNALRKIKYNNSNKQKPFLLIRKIKGTYKPGESRIFRQKYRILKNSVLIL